MPPVTRLTVTLLAGAVEAVTVKVAVPPSSLIEALLRLIERIGYGLTLTLTCTWGLGSMFGPTAMAWISRVTGVVKRVTVNEIVEELIFCAVRRFVSAVPSVV